MRWDWSLLFQWRGKVSSHVLMIACVHIFMWFRGGCLGFLGGFGSSHCWLLGFYEGLPDFMIILHRQDLVITCGIGEILARVELLRQIPIYYSFPIWAVFINLRHWDKLLDVMNNNWKIPGSIFGLRYSMTKHHRTKWLLYFLFIALQSKITFSLICYLKGALWTL